MIPSLWTWELTVHNPTCLCNLNFSILDSEQYSKSITGLCYALRDLKVGLLSPQKLCHDVKQQYRVTKSVSKVFWKCFEDWQKERQNWHRCHYTWPKKYCLRPWYVLPINWLQHLFLLRFTFWSFRLDSKEWLTGKHARKPRLLLNIALPKGVFKQVWGLNPSVILQTPLVLQ